MRTLKAISLGIVCFALGAGVTRYYDSRRLTAPLPVQTAKLAADNATAVAEDKSAIDFETLV